MPLLVSCAFLMPVGSFQFIATGRVAHRYALGLALGGIPAVLVAAYVVKAMPLTTLRWAVVVVVAVAAVQMLRDGLQGRD